MSLASRKRLLGCRCRNEFSLAILTLCSFCLPGLLHAQERDVEIRSLVIEPVMVASKPDTRPALTVEAMVRPPKDISSVFARLKTNRSYLESAQVDSGVRTLASSSQNAEKEEEPMTASEWEPVSYHWETPAFCHRPLYFEQPNLERYGSRNPKFVTPVLSAGHFYGSLLFMPWQVFRDHPNDCHCTLGNRRPGNCNPLQRHH